MTKYEKIKLIILDVDGTLTDGGVYYDSFGNELKRFDVKDGLALKVAITAGLVVAIVTGRKSSMVQRRAEELQVHYLMMGVQQKYSAICELISNLEISLEEVLYIGDDLNDLQCIQECGLAACPNGAVKEVELQCDYVAKNIGGQGAVRECIEWLLKERGDWEKTTRRLYFV